MQKELNLESLKEYRFRLSPHYKIIPLNQITYLIENLNKEEDSLFGIIEHQKSKAYRIIDCNTALLLYTLREGSILPYHVIKDVDESFVKEIKFMLGINILELSSDGKQYISGDTALAHLNKKASAPIALINNKAILEGYSLLPTDHLSLATALYKFNQKPVSKLLKALLYDEQSVKKFFGLDEYSDKNKTFYKEWMPIPKNEGWIGFINQKNIKQKNGATYKLYLSPDKLDIFQNIFFDVSSLLYQSNAFQFKIGHDAYGLQRADKWVAYFYTKESLYQAIVLLEKNIGDISAQEVPFSGLSNLKWLGWGKDPKDDRTKSISWRWLVCQEIAHALLDTYREDKNASIEKMWTHINIRLERENINSINFESME